MFINLAVGLAAALTFGASDVLSGVAARRLGTMRTVAGTRFVGAVAFFLIVMFMGRWLPWNPVWLLKVASLGVFGAIGYLALVQAFNLGPMSVVSTIIGSLGAFSVLFAVVMLNDQLNTFQWIAVPIATIGSILAAVVFDRGHHLPRLVGRGPLFAIVAVACLAGVTVVQQAPIREVGWAQEALGRRLTETVILCTALSLLACRTAMHRPAPACAPSDVCSHVKDAPVPHLHRQRPLHWLTPDALGWLIAVGLLDSLSFGILVFGLSIAPAWLIGLVTSVGAPVVSISVGLTLFHENLRKSQWFGIILVMSGLVVAAVK